MAGLAKWNNLAHLFSKIIININFNGEYLSLCPPPHQRLWSQKRRQAHSSSLLRYSHRLGPCTSSGCPPNRISSQQLTYFSFNLSRILHNSWVILSHQALWFVLLWPMEKGNASWPRLNYNKRQLIFQRIFFLRSSLRPWMSFCAFTSHSLPRLSREPSEMWKRFVCWWNLWVLWKLGQ